MQQHIFLQDFAGDAGKHKPVHLKSGSDAFIRPHVVLSVLHLFHLSYLFIHGLTWNKLLFRTMKSWTRSVNV